LHLRASLWLLFVVPLSLCAQEMHSHGVPETLGTVSFNISCEPSTQKEFNRGVALLHSFAYSAAEVVFRKVSESDPQCAMARWGVAMTYFHQLWDPPLSSRSMWLGKAELQRARAIGSNSRRERNYIDALGFIYWDDSVPFASRVSQYQVMLCELASGESTDVEAQVFCALALLASASPKDKSHVNQKRAADLLQPLFRQYPEHPGIPHYLIHAYDNAELAPMGLPAATAYSKIAPSAPHALHMPSHIFTRLGLWRDSIAANGAAREAAHQQGDIGEELHAMDYLVYAYLQVGEETKAAEVLEQLRKMAIPNVSDFKTAYAATAMPVRYIVERGRWKDAADIVDPAGVPPHVLAIATWARGLGFARSRQTRPAEVEIAKLNQIEHQLQTSDNQYWAAQVRILSKEVIAWSAEAGNKHKEALASMREAADEEDAIEKLPVTPGPIVPAREQLGYLLLEQNQYGLALKQFRTALTLAPGRRGAMRGAKLASDLSRPK
jgi:tetratricopeptide (TPR) repeat protein